MGFNYRQNTCNNGGHIKHKKYDDERVMVKQERVQRKGGAWAGMKAAAAVLLTLLWISATPAFAESESEPESSGAVAVPEVIAVDDGLDAVQDTVQSTELAAQKNTSPWQLAMTIDKLPHPVSVYTRALAGAQLKQFRGETVVDANVVQVLALLMDVDNIPRLFYNGKLAKIVENNVDEKSTEKFLYLQIASIWPSKDRDVVIRPSMVQNKETYAISLQGVSVAGQYTRQKGHVRMNDLRSDWTVTPLKGGKTRVVFTGHADPGGMIPAWLANLVVTDMPRVSLSNMHYQVKDWKYRRAQLAQLSSELIDVAAVGLIVPEFHKVPQSPRVKK